MSLPLPAKVEQCADKRFQSQPKNEAADIVILITMNSIMFEYICIIAHQFFVTKRS